MRSLSRVLRVGACALAFFAPARAATFTILHTFGGGTDGGNSMADVTLDEQGNIYGTTFYGGPADLGTVFKISADGREKILHAFTGNGDGGEPQAGLSLGPDGALYGTTRSGGGGTNAGVIFRITPDGHQSVLHVFDRDAEGDGSVSDLALDKNGDIFGVNAFGGSGDCGTVYELPAQGDLTVLHAFQNDGHDGCAPTSRPVFDASGNLYGTTLSGGKNNVGTIYKVSVNGKENVFYAFKSGAGGANPHGDLAIDKNGNLYGTTEHGGAADLGTVFELSPDGVETVLHSFTGEQTGDGSTPLAGVVLGGKGKIYGMTPGGGTGYGVVFRLRRGRETVLHAFNGHKEGANPQAGLAIDLSGNLYGTTVSGGNLMACTDLGGCGTVFRVTP